MIRSSLESKIYILKGHVQRTNWRATAPGACRRATDRRSTSPSVDRPWTRTAGPHRSWWPLCSSRCCFYRLRRTPFQWQLFLSTFYRVNWIWLAVSIFLMLLTYVGRALRWEVMLRPLGRKLSLRKLTYDTAIGFTAVVLLGRPGEVVRPYLISRPAPACRFPRKWRPGCWSGCLDLLVVLLLFGFGLTQIPAHGLALGPGLRWVLGAGGYLVAGIGVACVLFLILFRNFSGPVRQRLLSALTFLPPKHYERAGTHAGGLLARAWSPRAIRGSWRCWWFTRCSSGRSSWRATMRCFIRFQQRRKFEITDVVVFLGFVAFGSIVQIPGIGGGIQVVSIVVLTEIYGLSLEAATGVAIFIWIITFVVVVPFGLSLRLSRRASTGVNSSICRKTCPYDLSLLRIQARSRD